MEMHNSYFDVLFGEFWNNDVEEDEVVVVEGDGW